LILRRDGYDGMGMDEETLVGMWDAEACFWGERDNEVLAWGCGDHVICET